MSPDLISGSIQTSVAGVTRGAAMGELSAAWAWQCHNNIVTHSDTDSMGSSDHAEKKFLLQLILPQTFLEQESHQVPRLTKSESAAWQIGIS